jgi:glycosyltransferase involved in cell wall biosynthesis
MTKQAPVLISRPDVAVAAASLGKAHYSYGFAAGKFVAMLRDRQIPVRLIEAPERFKSPLYAALEQLEDIEHLHLVFRSTEEIRVIPGAYNIACFAWEFEALKTDGVPEEAIVFDQVRMLGTCQEVWVPCTYTRDVLTKYGIANTHIIPAPVQAPEGRRGDRLAEFEKIATREAVPLVSQSSANEEEFARLARRYSAPLGSHPQVERAIRARKLFLTVCNPYDKRKNLVSMIEGFLMATQGDDDAVLLVKLVTSGKFEQPSGYLFHQMRVIFGNPHCLHEDKIVLMSGYLEEDELSALYRCADFYVCASIAEGQNLPLLEAMAHGCCPVSVRNTAMADYIDETNAVTIAERSFSGLQSGLAGHVAQTRLTIDFADRFQVGDAIGRALGLSEAEREAKAQAAARVVRERFSPRRVFAAMVERLEAVRPQLVPRAAHPLWLKLLGKRQG